MAAPDPVDVRLLSVVAETGRAAVHEIAGRLGMDIREVAARLASLSTTGLPLLVGVECDPNGIRNAIAAANAYQQPSGPHPVQGQAPAPPPNPGRAPGAGGPHPGQASSGSHPVPPSHSGSHPAPAPNGWYPQHPGGSYPHPHGQNPAQSNPYPPPSFSPHASVPAQHGSVPTPTGMPDPATTWGPPGSASWARGDQRAAGAQPPQPAPVPAGTVGSKLDVDGYEGERITIQLVEVVDPADFLYTAAGYQLQDGERAVVVHTEVTNRGGVPFTALPDEHLELIATDGSMLTKAPVSLTSRPPHQVGVAPGATAGGHTIYVIPEPVELIAVRWMPRPGDEQRTLTWDITEL